LTPLIALDRVSVTRQGRPVLRDITLAVSQGELVGLLGPNGAGKTTLIRAALGLGAASSGSIQLGGTQLGSLSGIERARRAAYIPQDRTIAWPVTVETLVGLGRMPHRASASADRNAVEAAMAEMGLEDMRLRPATRLSGGERARVLIARALAQEAPLLLADEPMAGLDPAHGLLLIGKFQRMARAGRGLLVSLHDLGLAARWCDRIVLMANGAIDAEGAPLDVLTPERLQQVYGIRAHVAHGADGLIILPVDVLGP
jgi:iron complex transport system ATP-binding protein